jgi:MFS family permease
MLTDTRRHVKSATFLFSPNRLYWSTRGMHPRVLYDRFSRSLAVYFLAATLFFAGGAAFWAPLPVYLTGEQFSGGEIFGAYLLASLASAVLYDPAGRLTDRFDAYLANSAALGLRGVLLPVVALGGMASLVLTKLLVGGAITLIGATWAIIAIAGTAIVTRLAPPAIRGEALGSLLGGWLAVHGYLLPFAIAGGLVLLGGVLVLVLAD